MTTLRLILKSGTSIYSSLSPELATDIIKWWNAQMHSKEAVRDVFCSLAMNNGVGLLILTAEIAAIVMDKDHQQSVERQAKREEASQKIMDEQLRQMKAGEGWRGE